MLGERPVVAEQLCRAVCCVVLPPGTYNHGERLAGVFRAYEAKGTGGLQWQNILAQPRAGTREHKLHYYVRRRAAMAWAAAR